MKVNTLREPKSRDEMVCGSCDQPMIKIGVIALNPKPISYHHKSGYFIHPFKHGSAYHGLGCGWSERFSSHNYVAVDGKFLTPRLPMYSRKWYHFCFFLCGLSKEPDTGKRISYHTPWYKYNFRMWDCLTGGMFEYLWHKVTMQHCPKTRIGKAINLLVCMAIGFKPKFKSEYKNVNDGYIGMAIGGDELEVWIDPLEYSD